MKNLTRQDLEFDCIIIGGGPGGLISALYLRRFGRKTLLIHSGKPRAAWGPKVNNLIGYNQGISGKTLLRRIEKQLHQVGGLTRIEANAKVIKLKTGFTVTTDQGGEYRARKVILATGIEDVHPKVPNLNQLRTLGILKYCSICDGYENAGKPIAVLAQDNFGIQKALFIANWTKAITIIVPMGMQIAAHYQHLIRKYKIRVLPCKEMQILPMTKGHQAKIKVDEEREIQVSAIYVELGCRVRDEAYRSLRSLRRSKEGFIITTVEQRTSIAGLFAVGDCVNLLGQISVAAGQAAVAATTIHNDLSES